MSARLFIPQGLRTVSKRSLIIVNTLPLLCVAVLVVVDLATILGSVRLAIWLRSIAPGGQYMALDNHYLLWPLFSLFLLLFAMLRLYALPLINQVDELKRSFVGVTLGFVFAASSVFLIKDVPEYSRGAFVIAWLLALMLVPFGRLLIRFSVGQRQWWGHPVVILGAGYTGKAVVRALQQARSMGLRPVALLDDDVTKHGEEVRGVPIAGPLSLAPILARDLRVKYAILAMPGASLDRLQALERENQRVFPHLILVPNLCTFASLWVTTCDLGGVLGLEVRRNLLLRTPRVMKRTMDLFSCLLGSLPFICVVGVISLAIKLEGSGPIFYSQERVGRDGRKFRAWTACFSCIERFQP